jgi:hypothetical protein
MNVSKSKFEDACPAPELSLPPSSHPRARSEVSAIATAHLFIIISSRKPSYGFMTLYD